MSSVYSTYPDTPLSPPSTTETLCFGPNNNSSLQNHCRQPCLFPGTLVLVQQAEHPVLCARMSPLPSATTLHYRCLVTSGLSSAQALKQGKVHIPFRLRDQHPQPTQGRFFPSPTTDLMILLLPNSPSPVSVLVTRLCTSHTEVWAASHVPTNTLAQHKHVSVGEHGLCLARAPLASTQPHCSVELISAAFENPCERISLYCPFL